MVDRKRLVVYELTHLGAIGGALRYLGYPATHPSWCTLSRLLAAFQAPREGLHMASSSGVATFRRTLAHEVHAMNPLSASSLAEQFREIGNRRSHHSDGMPDRATTPLRSGWPSPPAGETAL